MFAEECKRAAGGAWTAYEQHPWFTALEKGRLSVAEFVAFQVADAPFVPQIHRVLAFGLAKAPSGSEWGRTAATLLDEVFVANEMEAKRKVLAGLGVSDVRFDRWALTPPREAYANHMLRVALEGTAGQIAAVLLPCALFSDVVGRRFEGREIAGPRPFKEWANIYANKQVYRMAEAHAELMEKEARQGEVARSEMRRIYVRSVQHQVAVFDAALTGKAGWVESGCPEVNDLPPQES